MKLEVRYTVQDGSAWIDVIAAAIFLFWGFLEYTLGWLMPEPGRPFGLILMAYGLLRLIAPFREWRNSQVGKVCCVIDEDGMHWYGRAWYRFWGWGKLTTMPWKMISRVKRLDTSTVVNLYPRQIVIYLFRCGFNTPAGSIIHQQVDKSDGEVTAAIKEHAPNVPFDGVAPDSSPSA